MLMIIALALLQSSDANLVDANSVVWAKQTTDKDRFWITQREIHYEENTHAVVVWLHGDHRRNPLVKYRTSLWRLRFPCDGTMQVTAATTLDANGKQVSNWDGYAGPTYIRPGTIYESIETQFCVSRR